MFALSFNPATGDAGLSPIIVTLAIICTVIVVAGFVWMLLISRKRTDVTSTDAEELAEQTPEHTVVETIEQPVEPSENNLNDPQ